MKIEDVELYTWLKYDNKYWFVIYLEEDVCYLAKDSDEISLTKCYFEKHHIEPVQPPVFQLYEQVLCRGSYLYDHQNNIVTIVKIDSDKSEPLKYLIEGNGCREWASPFDLQKLDY